MWFYLVLDRNFVISWRVVSPSRLNKFSTTQHFTVSKAYVLLVIRRIAHLSVWFKLFLGWELRVKASWRLALHNATLPEFIKQVFSYTINGKHWNDRFWIRWQGWYLVCCYQVQLYLHSAKSLQCHLKARHRYNAIEANYNPINFNKIIIIQSIKLIKFIQSLFFFNCLAEDTNRLLFDLISRPEHAQDNCGEKQLPFNRKKPPSEPEPGRAPKVN